MFITTDASFIVAVPPPYLHGLEFLAAEESLDSRLLTFDERIGGILLAYENLESEDGVGIMQDEQPDVLFRFTAKVLLYCPKKGEKFNAIVSDITAGHVTLLLAGVFPIIVRSTNYPKGCVFSSDGTKKCLKNSKDNEQLICEGDEKLIKCIKVSHQGGNLTVEGAFYA